MEHSKQSRLGYYHRVTGVGEDSESTARNAQKLNSTGLLEKTS